MKRNNISKLFYYERLHDMSKFISGSRTIDKSWNKRLCLRPNLSICNRLLKYYIDQVIKPCKERQGICVERACPNVSCLRSLASLPTNCDYVNFFCISISLQTLALCHSNIYVYYACNIRFALGRKGRNI